MPTRAPGVWRRSFLIRERPQPKDRGRRGGNDTRADCVRTDRW